MNLSNDAMEERCRQIATAHPQGPKLFESEVSDRSALRERMLRARSYEPVRYSFYMVRPNLDDLPNAPMPEGLEVREVRPEYLRAIFDAEPLA